MLIEIGDELLAYQESLMEVHLQFETSRNYRIPTNTLSLHKQHYIRETDR